MDFSFTEVEERFRQEVRDFLAQELPRDWMEVGIFQYETFAALDFKRSMQRKLAQKGWLALTWPKKYGGSERPHMEQVILMDELGYHGSPGWEQFGCGMFGPVLLLF